MAVAALAARGVAGASRTGAGARAAGSAKHAAKPARVPTKAGGPKHAAPGQSGRDARQLGDLGLAYAAGRGRKGTPGQRSRWSPTRALVAEFVLCTVVLALSPLAAAEGETSPKDWMKRGTALCAVFMLLGMVAGVGPRAGRVSVALGGLITVVLAVDQRAIFGVIASKVKPTGEPRPDVVGPPDEPGSDEGIGPRPGWHGRPERHTR